MVCNSTGGSPSTLVWMLLLWLLDDVGSEHKSIEGLPGGRCRELSCPLTIYMAHRLCFVYIVLNFLRYKYRLHPGVLIEDVCPTRTCTYLAYLKEILLQRKSWNLYQLFIQNSNFFQNIQANNSRVRQTEKCTLANIGRISKHTLVLLP